MTKDGKRWIRDQRRPKLPAAACVWPVACQSLGCWTPVCQPLFQINGLDTRSAVPVSSFDLVVGCIQQLGRCAPLSWPTLLLPKDAPPADFPFDAAGSPDAIRGATAAVTRMASATCATLTLECPCLAIPECHRCERGAARGNSSLLQSPAAGVDSHAPVDSETDLTLAV